MQSDGKIIIGGNFTAVGSTARNRIARLNANGTLDATFSVGTGFDQTVETVAVQPDGKILVGGWFTTYNGSARNRIVRLNSNGTLDATFNSGTGSNGTVNTIKVLSSGKILLGGIFNSYNGSSSPGIARLNSDGTFDATFSSGTGTNSNVTGIAVLSTGKMIITGSFSTYNGSARSGIARINSDGTLDAGFVVGSGFNGAPTAVVAQTDDKVVVGGSFTTYNGSSRSRLVRLNTDGTADAAFTVGFGPNGPMYALIQLSSGKIMAFGGFMIYNGVPANSAARLNADGSIDTTFNPGAGANSLVYTLGIQPDGKILVGGGFSGFNGTLARRLVRLNTDGTPDATFNMSNGFKSTESQDLGIHVSYRVSCTAIQPDGKIIVGGRFDSCGTFGRKNIVRLNSDGSVDASFNPGSGTNAEVVSIAIQPDGKIIIGGNFTSYNGTTRLYLTRLNSDGSADASWPSTVTVNSVVRSVVLQQDGKILVGGAFTTFAGTSRQGIVRVNSDGSLDESFNPGTGISSSSRVYDIKLQADGKVIIGGDFLTFNGNARSRIARLNSDGSLDASFTPGTGVTGGATTYVSSIAVNGDGNILIGGIFDGYNGTALKNIARLTPAGSLDAAFSTAAPNSEVTVVWSLALQADGKAVIGGMFTSYNGTGRNRVARLLADLPRSIATGTVNSPLCTLVPVTVPFTITGTFNSGNIFTAQLSDASGSFANPVSIGTLTGTSSGSINVTIPSNTAAGSGYRIRVVSNNPSVTGTDNGSNITITQAPSATIRYAGAPFCMSAATAGVTLTGTGGGTFSAAPAGLSINSATGAIDIGASAAGSYSVTYSMAASGGCAAASAFTIVNITAVPAVAAPASQVVCPGSPTAPVTFNVTPAGSLLRWTNSDTSIGLGAKGYRNIPAFTAVNNTQNQQTAALTATPLKGLLYVVKSGNSNVVSVISRAFNEVAFNIPIGSAPDGIAVSSDGALIATADWGSDQVSIIDASTHSVLGTVGVGDEPYSLTFTPDGSRLYVANLAGNTVSVVDVNTRSLIGTITVGLNPVAIVASRDGSRVYVANSTSNTVSVISTATNTVTSNVTVTGFPANLAQSPDGSRIYVSRSNGLNLMAINTSTLTTSLVANVGASNTGIAVSPDGTRVYVGRSNTAQVYVVNTTNNTVETIINVGAGVLQLALTADGSTLYTSNQSGNSVSVINTATNTVISTIAGITFPSGIAVSPDATCTGATQNFSITIDAPRSASISYGADVLCTGAGAAAVTVTGTTQGVFSAAPAGLQIDSNTGTISPAQSAPGTYVVRYFLASTGGACADFNAYDTITIATTSTTFIRYNGSPYCPNQGSVAVTKVGSANGTFSATPAGLDIDAATGAVNTNTSQAGTYTVTFTLSNPPLCGNATAKAFVIISPLPTIDPLPNQTLCSGGTLTAPVTGTASIHDWINSDTSIGLPAAGTGMIWGWPVHNNTNVPIVSTVSYLPRSMGNQAWVPLYNTNNVLLYDITSGHEWFRMPVGTTPMGVAVSPSGSRVYVTNNGSASVSVINPNVFSVIATIPVGTQPYGVAVTPDGARVYVANQGSNNVSVIDAATNTVIATIPVGGANAIAVNPAGTKVYVSSYNNRVYIINTANNTVIKNVQVGGAPEGIDFTPDGSKLFIANQFSNDVTVMDGNTDVVIATMLAGLQPEGVVVSKDGSKVYVVNQASNNVFIFNALTHAFIDSIQVGNYPEAASLTQDGSQLFVTNVGGKSISVINTATNTVVNTIPTTTNPYGLGNFISPFRCSGPAQSFTVTVNPAPSATIDYSGSPYCGNAGTATVAQTGTSGGHYSSSPAGLALNATTGSFALDSSLAGTYVVTYTIDSTAVCSAFATSDTIVIVGPVSANINYAASPYCSNAGMVSPLLSGSTGGVYTAAPAGLSIDANSGAINTGLSQPGTYVVSYSFPANGPCGAFSTSDTVVITAAPTASIAYNGSPFCAGAGNAAVSFSGTTGGIFSASPAGLAIDSISGNVNVNASIAGSYIVSYQLPAAGGCAAITATNSIVVSTVPLVNQPANAIACAGVATTPIAFTGNYSPAAYYWTISDTSLGLPASGYGPIPSFVPVNNSGAPMTATITVAPITGLLYGAESSTNKRIAVINRATRQVIQRFATVQTGPSGIALTRDGRKLYTCNFENANVSVIDLTTQTEITTIPASPSTYSMVLSPDETRLYVVGIANSNVTIINTQTNSVITRVTVGGSPRGIAITPDGSKVFVACRNSNRVAVISTSSNTQIASIVVPGGPYALAVSPDGSKVYVSCATGASLVSMNTSSYTLTNVATVGSGSAGIAVSADGSRVYLAHAAPSSLRVIDPAAQAVVASIPLSNFPVFVQLTPDGKEVYVNNQADTSISVVNLETNTVTRVATMMFPSGMAATQDGSCTGTPKSFTLTVNPAPAATIAYAASPYCNNGGLVQANFSGTTGGKWTASPAGLTIDSTTGQVNPSASQAGTYTVTYTVAAQNTCNSFTTSTSITITAAPHAQIAYAQASYCAGAGTVAVQLTGNSGGTFTASPAGLAIDSLSGSVNTMLSQAGTYVVTYTIAAAGGCASFSTTATVTILPAAIVSPVTSKVYCADERSMLITFGGGTAGTTYEWTNDNTTIGVAASGSGSIPAFTAANSGNTAAMATITVTPYLNGCSGAPATFTLTVNPLPSVNALSNQVACAGSNVAPISFSGPVAGTSFSWTNNNTSIGLAASGNGPVPAFTAQNSGTAPTSAAIRVLATITANGLTCNGRTTVLTITVNPTPTVTAVANQAVCNNTSTQAVSFSGNVPGTIYKWTNSNPSIGLAASGTGDIPSFTGVNATASVQTATITVIPQFFGGTLCSGSPVSFTISVQPDLAGSTTFSYSGSPYCSNAGSIAPAFTGVNGGRFSATPAGLSIDSTTGAVNTMLSQPGSYTVNYTISGLGGTCNQVSSTSVSIIPATTASISYPASPYCASGTALVQRSGNAGGHFTASPSGLSIDSLSGTINLSASQAGNYIVTYTVTAPGSGCATVQATAALTVNAVPSANPVSNQVLCNGSNSAAITFSGPVAGTTFSWTNNNTSIGLAAAGTNTVPAFTANNNSTTTQQATIRVTPTSPNGAGVCTGASSIVMILVNPVANVNPVASQNVCAGTGTQAVAFSGAVPGAIYKWANNNTAIGLAANGTGDIASFTAQNNTAAPISATITVTPQSSGGGANCNGTPATFTITVQPFTSGTSISYPASPYCAAAGPVAPVVSGSTGGRFSGPAGLVLDTITGVIKPSLSVPGIYTVNYVVANGGLCPQFASTSVTILATPSATISYAASPYCQSGTANVLRSGTGGGTYSASPAGLSITASTGAIALVSSAAGTYTVTYTVSAGSGCGPFTTTTTLTVAPTPTVNSVSNQVWCNGNTTNAVTFTGTAPNTVYNWTNNAPSIGLPASGSGNIGAFTAVNNGAAQVRATISVTPSLSNGSSSCPGRTVTFNISVNPTPTVTPVANQTVCKGNATSQITLSGPVAGTTYNWTNNNTVVGLGANGSNTVPSFVAQNPTANPIAATVTITPNYLNGVRCFGPAITYTYTVNNCAPRLVTKGGVPQPIEEKELASLITVGPNPTPTGVLYIYYTGAVARRLTYLLSDAQGRALRAASLQGARTLVDLRGYAAGSYLLQVIDPQTGATVKQVILRP